ncbi:hypothetical protein MLD38_015418 [Melastoma candidum]|uniref:Uncharacterized protein n=1 Tax=Melastoma candidum TaxID=119954 RepID=A0ACB9RFB8_9MYRT|nr:hypothetical protein MLD38_015418 [Melastoma candidum]
MPSNPTSYLTISSNDHPPTPLDPPRTTPPENNPRCHRPQLRLLLVWSMTVSFSFANLRLVVVGCCEGEPDAVPDTTWIAVTAADAVTRGQTREPLVEVEEVGDEGSYLV